MSVEKNIGIFFYDIQNVHFPTHGNSHKRTQHRVTGWCWSLTVKTFALIKQDSLHCKFQTDDKNGGEKNHFLHLSHPVTRKQISKVTILLRHTVVRSFEYFITVEKVTSARSQLQSDELKTHFTCAVEKKSLRGEMHIQFNSNFKRHSSLCYHWQLLQESPDE